MKATIEDQIFSIIEMPAVNGARYSLGEFDTEALEEAYRYLYDKKKKKTLQKMIWRELRARKSCILENPQPKESWMKKYEKEWDTAVRRIREAGTTKYDYAALLTKRKGTEVIAVRMDSYKCGKDVLADLDKYYPEWKVKGVWRLNDEDFE